MHGDVRVESSPAGGARFVLTLPVLPDERRVGDGGRREAPPRRPRSGASLLAVAGLAVVAGCAIPTQSAPSTIAPSKVPFNLLDPHLPTTTTTQPKPSSLVPVKVFFLNSSNQLTAGAAVRGRAGAADRRSSPPCWPARPGPRRPQGHLHRHPEQRDGALGATTAGGHRHREHEQRLRRDHRDQHRAGGGADRRHGRQRERAEHRRRLRDRRAAHERARSPTARRWPGPST